MPLNPKASFISDPQRAAQLFPAQPCRQCNGTSKVQKYESVECETCRGTKKVPGAAGSETPCPDCYSHAQGVATGTRQVPQSTPCLGCQGTGTKSRVRETRPTTLGSAKPADWMVIGVEFPAAPVEDAGTYVSAGAELVSCMVVRVPPGRFIVRVLQSPEYSDSHGLKYGDLLELGPNHILVHTQCTQEEFEKARDGGLFNFAPVMAIPPVPGRQFITRGGAKARVWTVRNDQAGQFAIGEVGGVDTEWNMDGSDRKGNRAGDLIQFTEVVNA